MMARKFAKTYRAIVTPGAPEPSQGVVDEPLRRDEQGREAFMRTCKPDHPDRRDGAQPLPDMAQAPGRGVAEPRSRDGPDASATGPPGVHLGRPIAGDARYGGSLVVGGHPDAEADAARRGAAVPASVGRRKAVSRRLVPADMAALIEALGLG